MCQGFSDFSGFLHHFVLAKLATSSSIRVNGLKSTVTYVIDHVLFGAAAASGSG